MEIGNFNNSISNSLCDYVFYLSKSFMVIAYLLYAALLKYIVDWTIVLAIFNAIFRKKLNIFHIYLGRILYWNILSSFRSSCWYVKCLLELSGDIKLNPGHKTNSCRSFSICHWNLNSITSHSFIKVSLLTTYNSIHKFDISCLSETYVNSETLSNDESLYIPDYNLITADHQSNTKPGRVCIYFKESLPLRLYNVSYLKEWICSKLCFQINFATSYHFTDHLADLVMNLRISSII